MSCIHKNRFIMKVRPLFKKKVICFGAFGQCFLLRHHDVVLAIGLDIHDGLQQAG